MKAQEVQIVGQRMSHRKALAQLLPPSSDLVYNPISILRLYPELPKVGNSCKMNHPNDSVDKSQSKPPREEREQDGQLLQYFI